MKFFKIVLGLIGYTLSTTLVAQTTTTTSGTWSDGSIWSAGVPGTGNITANVNNILEINSNIVIGTSGNGVFNIFQSMTDFPGGTEYYLDMGGNATLDVQGGTTYFGTTIGATTSNGSSLRIRNGATLILNGATSFANGSTVLIDAGGTLIINGDFSNDIRNGSFTVEGTVQINGDYNSNGNVDVLGNGNFFTTGSLTTGGASGTVFGSGNNCDGPCSGQNLCLGTGTTNSITSIPLNQSLCAGGTASPLTADAIASATYQWQSSTVSATSSFSNIPTASAQNYNPGTPTQTTWFRRVATITGCTGTSPAGSIIIVPASSWMGTTSANWNTASNWCGGALPTAGTDVVISPGTGFDPIVSAATIALCRNLTLNSGATLTVSVVTGTPRQINVSGNIVNNGTLTVDGIIDFNGSTAQTISGSGFGTFTRVIVNNSSGATPALTIPSTGLNITTQLTMTAGKINLSGANLTLGTAANSVGTLTYTNGWVYNGNVTRWMATGALALANVAGQFPIGSAGDYRPIFFGNTTGITTGGTIRVSHTAVNGSSSVVFSDNGTPIQVRTNSFWSVATGNGLATGNNFSIRTDGTNMGSVGAVNDLRLTQVGSATFGTPPAGNGGTTTNPQVTRNAIPLANLTSNFYWGSIDAVNTPLPVELINFTAALKFDIVDLNWSTASERKNDFFTIERSVDLEHFDVVATIAGSGTTNVVHRYNTIDPSPVYGRSYYRLKQTDFEGAVTYSEVRVVDYEGTRFSILSVYPNPLSGSKLTVVITGLKDQTSVPVVIYNVQGQQVFGQIFTTNTPGTLRQEIELTERLKSGFYVIKAGLTLQLVQKLVVE